MAKKDHTLSFTEAVKATCTQAGHIAYWSCDVCGKVFSDAEGKNAIRLENTVIQPTGHGTTELRNQKGATCTEAGYTGDTVCKDCGAVLAKGTTTPPLAHNYQNGKCTVCGAADPRDRPTAVSPQTGDNSHMTLWMVMFFAAAGILGISVYGKQKKRKNS